MLTNGNLALQGNYYEEENTTANVDMKELELSYMEQMDLLYKLSENTKDSNVRYMVDKQMTSLNNIYRELTGQIEELENDLGENMGAYEEFLNSDEGDELAKAYAQSFEENNF